MPRILLFLLLTTLIISCSSSRRANEVPKSDDLLELLTGFGEAISQRNFQKAVQFLTEEERYRITGGQKEVPEEMQQRLMALPLQKLIRKSSIRVEDGRIAGIYAILPSLEHGQVDSTALELAQEQDEFSDELSIPEEEEISPEEELLQEMTQEFFSAIDNKNWEQALQLIHENERKILVDDSGKLTETAKSRLSRINRNIDAMMLRDGKLTGITLLLPVQ